MRKLVRSISIQFSPLFFRGTSRPRQSWHLRLSVAAFVVGLAIAMASPLQGQDLLLQYDYVSGDVGFFRYYIDGKTFQTTENTVGFGARLVVKVVNVNQNIYSVNSISTGRAIAASSERVDLLGAVANARKMRPQVVAAAEMYPSRDRASGDNDIKPGQRRRAPAARPRIRASNVPSEIVTAARELMTKIAKQEHGFYGGLQKYNNVVDQTIQRAAPLVELLEAAAEARNASEALVKRRVTEALQIVLPDNPQNKTAGYNVGDIMKYASSGYSTMSDALNTLQNLYIDLDASYEQMLALATKYPEARGIMISDTSAGNTFIRVDNWVQETHRNQVRYDLQGAISLLESVEQSWTDYFRNVAEVYSAIQDMSFSYQYEVVATGDHVDVEIKIHDRGTRQERLRGEGIHLVSNRSYAIPVNGGWKMNTSLGLAGNYYFHNQSTFSVRPDNQIAEASIDRFTPALTAMLHLYRRSAGAITFGPAVGLGLTFNESKGASILLGGSAILGESERLVATLGLLGGEVTKLTPGYQIGSQANPAIPITTTGFDYGIFFGMSYNIFPGF